MDETQHSARRAVGCERGPETSRSTRRVSFFRGSACRVTILLILAAAIARLVLPWAVRDYANRILDLDPLYDGSIGRVSIHLWRGAYSIENIRITKLAGEVPAPLFEAKKLDFALDWRALLHGRVLARVRMENPAINFVDAPEEADRQTGAGGAWLQVMKELSPFRINSAVIVDGSIHFRTSRAAAPVDVYLSGLEATLSDLGNIDERTEPLVASLQATGLVMDHAKFELNMKIDPLSYQPTFHVAMRLLNLDVTKINDLALAYGKFDFKRGWFDLVVEADSKEGNIQGYAKPLFRNLQVFDVQEDLRTKNPLQFFWQALVGGATRVFKNPPRDQFGTLVAFTGDPDRGTSPDILRTLANILRNAFVRAYLPKLEGNAASDGFLNFSPPELTDPLSVGDSP